MGEGGGWSSSSGEGAFVVSIDDCELGEGKESARLARVRGDLDLAAATSGLSETSAAARIVELRGLSVLLDPGILDRSDRRDREDSFVSDLLKDGYDCRFSGTPVDLEDPAPESLDGWLPMILNDRIPRWLRKREGEGLDGVRVSGLGLRQGRL